jgi:cytochrome P450
MFGRGPAWKRFRTFLQTDLLHPDAAARFGPAVVQAAGIVSRYLPHYQEQGRLNDYLNVASFTMFSNVLLGQIPKVLEPKSATAHDTASASSDLEFCNAFSKGLSLNVKLLYSAYNTILTKGLGIKTSAYREFEKSWHFVQTTARAKVQELYERRQSQQLTDAERQSYANQAFERHEAAVRLASETESSTTTIPQLLTLEEVKMSVVSLLAGAVDTTSGLLAWKLLHIALSESTQAAIYAELQQSMHRHKVTALTPECLTSSEAPMLHAALREAHRLSNPAPLVPVKMLEDSVVVHGVTLPPGSVVALDGYTTGIREDIVGPNALDFDPTRFLPAAVAARKQQLACIIDHPFFSGPFSQGARKCSGSRVANLEVTALMAQIVLDWHISIPGVRHWTEVPYDLDAITVPKLPAMEFTPRSVGGASS